MYRKRLIFISPVDGLEVESLYDKFFSCLKGEEDQLMSEKSFRASFAKFFPFWKHLVDTHFVDDIFKVRNAQAFFEFICSVVPNTLYYYPVLR
jgi:hypothetical protein